MTTYTQKRRVIYLHNLLIWFFGTLGLLLDGMTLADVFGELCLSMWVFRVYFERIELKLYKYFGLRR